MTINRGLILGIVLLLIYCVVCALRKEVPDLPKLVSVVAIGVGIDTGLFLGYSVLFFEDIAFGEFSDHRFAILVGGIAIIYVSIVGLFKCFSRSETKN